METQEKLEKQLASKIYEIPLFFEENEIKTSQNPDFVHGFVYTTLKESYNKAFNFAYQNQIKVPAKGPIIKFILPDGSIYLTVQWGVTHKEIQAEIEEEFLVDYQNP
jgi:hypothetical protein